MFPGSVDLGPGGQPPGHIYLGGTAYDELPTSVPSSGYVDFSAGGIATLQIPTPTVLSEFTYMTVIDNVITVGSNNMIDELNSFGVNFLLQPKATDTTRPYPGMSFNNNPGGAAFPSFYTYEGVGHPHILTWRYDGTTFTIFLDDVCIASNDDASITSTVADFVLEILTNMSANAKNKIAAIGLWSRSLTNTELYNAVDSLMAHCGAFFPISLQQNYLFAEGDSLTAVYNPGADTTYARKYVRDDAPAKAVFGFDPAQAGASWDGSGTGVSFISQIPMLLGLLPPLERRGGRKFIMSIMLGTNDFGTLTSTPAQLATKIDGSVTTLKAGGYTHVVVGTVMSTVPLSNIELTQFFNDRTAYNILVRSGSYSWTGYFDFAADANLGALSAAANTTYFVATGLTGGGTHNTQTGADLMATIYKPVIDGILNS